MFESRKRNIVHTETIDVGSVAADAEVEVAVTIPNLGTPEGVAVVSAPSLESGLVATAYISGANEVTIRVSNVTESPIDPASQDFTVAVIL